MHFLGMWGHPCVIICNYSAIVLFFFVEQTNLGFMITIEQT